MSPSKTGKIVNKKELATIFGVSVQAVDGWLGRGCPFLKKGSALKGYEFDSGQVIAWKSQREIAEAISGNTASEEKDPDGRRKLKAEADLAELKAARECGQLVTLEDVEAAWDGIVANCRARLLGVGPKVAVLVHSAETADECQSIVESAIHEALHELADGDSGGQDPSDSASST